MTSLKEGDKAPFFKGINQDGKEITSEDFKGKKLVLYFYPKDNTSGCTAEACSLNDNYDTLTAQGYEVVGISPDSAGSHQKFIAKYNLAFNLIADTDKKILEDYGLKNPCTDENIWASFGPLLSSMSKESSKESSLR